MRNCLSPRPADDRFWAEVATRAASAEGRTQTLILERWAHGDYGHRWYLVEDGDLSSVDGSGRRQTLITAFFDAEVRRAARGEITRAVNSLCADDDDPCVVIFPLFVWPDEDVVFTQAVVPGEDGRIAAKWSASSTT